MAKAARARFAPEHARALGRAFFQRGKYVGIDRAYVDATLGHMPLGKLETLYRALERGERAGVVSSNYPGVRINMRFYRINPEWIPRIRAYARAGKK